MDDLGFIASGVSVKEIAKTLEEVGRLVLEWGEGGECGDLRYRQN